MAINVSSYCIEGYKFNNIHELSGLRVHEWCSVVTCTCEWDRVELGCHGTFKQRLGVVDISVHMTRHRGLRHTKGCTSTSLMEVMLMQIH